MTFLLSRGGRICHANTVTVTVTNFTGKNNGFPFLDILGYLKNTHKIPNWEE